MEEKFKFGIFALIVIIFQGFLKIYGVLLTGSLSFLSETVDTITDIIFISITLYAVYHSQKPPDFEHMYGHSKIDSIGAMVQGIILINLYIFLIFNAIQVIIAGTYVVNNPGLGLQLLIISFTVNLIFSRYLLYQGRRKKSLSLEIQGLNLFQDSLRAIIVIISFILALYGFYYFDPFISIALSIWIIIGAYKLTKEGIKDLSDINPINPLILEEMRLKIFDLEHVIAVNDLKIRASGSNLFLEVNLSVEDHISVVHAHEVTKSIRSMGRIYFPVYNVECIVQMNPLGSESSIGENVINLIHSMKVDYPDILEIKDINILKIEKKYFLAAIIVVSDNLTLEEAHNLCSKFEDELKVQAPSLYRIITHIEAEHYKKIIPSDSICVSVSPEQLQEIQIDVEKLLRKSDLVKGYHALEFWATSDYCMLEMHLFFDGSLNISKVHDYITELEIKIKKEIKIDNLQEIILHSEPITGQTDPDSVFF